MAEKSAHFAFGENWQSFAQVVTEQRIKSAEADILKLFPRGELVGKPFFDIGCGSGLSMLAALNLGATVATGIDIDANSVSAARSLLSRFAPEKSWHVEQKSVFDLAGGRDLPIVHSWGVLHHTGHMKKAIDVAASLVAPRGTLAIALYRRTTLCPLWQIEKRIYSTSGRVFQTAIAGAYKAAFVSALAATGKNPAAYIRDYRSKRGMSWSHDVHDWLGGYPYESAEPSETIDHLEALGFSVRHIDPGVPRVGVFSSGCTEYVATRRMSYEDS